MREVLPGEAPQSKHACNPDVAYDELYATTRITVDQLLMIIVHSSDGKASPAGLWQRLRRLLSR
jgi:hypothetical protein